MKRHQCYYPMMENHGEEKMGSDMETGIPSMGYIDAYLIVYVRV